MAILFSQLGIINEVPSKVFLEADDISVRSGLELLQQQFDFRLDNIIGGDGKLNNQLVILINGISIDKFEGLETIVYKDDKVLLICLVSGG